MPQPNLGVSLAKHVLSEVEGTPRPQRSEKTGCHFDPFDKAQDKLREKSFLDPSHSLGMTRLGVSLCDFAPWREKFPNPRASASRSCARAAQNLTYSNYSDLRVLSASFEKYVRVDDL
jgi:hypothetical protein